ncbi:hypothetical protein [Bernardetia sp.]|uniref:hypothetical protein n=1 Tax=Bernardetia sp. TaxID=1937974 RepID=UPI0025C63485|nr:hypothetical protein [Bernardetia sp.]
MKRITTTLLIACVSLFVFACGGKKAETTSTTDTENSSAEEQAQTMVEKTLKEAGAYEFLTTDKPCEVLTMAMVKEVFSPTVEVQQSDVYGCNYEWDRPNAAEIQEQMRKASLKDMMKFKPTFTVNFTISKANGVTPERFMPKKISKAQQEEIAKKANEKLTDEQKEAVGEDLAEDFTKSLIDKVNNAEFTPVEGVGDAAYWNPIGGGSLMVLAGDKILTLGVFVDEDLDKNIAKSKELAQKILNQ